MPAWADFATAAPDLAATGAARLRGRTAYLATIRPDGAPRIHPVTPIVGADRLFLFMEPTSPKGRDLERRQVYALHCGVEDNEGGGGEFWVRGHATRVTDAATRAQAVKASTYPPRERYILFELSIAAVQATTYDVGGPVHRRWSAS